MRRVGDKFRQRAVIDCRDNGRVQRVRIFRNRAVPDPGMINNSNRNTEVIGKIAGHRPFTGLLLGQVEITPSHSAPGETHQQRRSRDAIGDDQISGEPLDSVRTQAPNIEIQSFRPRHGRSVGPEPTVNIVLAIAKSVLVGQDARHGWSSGGNPGH